ERVLEEDFQGHSTARHLAYKAIPLGSLDHLLGYQLSCTSHGGCPHFHGQGCLEGTSAVLLDVIHLALQLLRAFHCAHVHEALAEGDQVQGKADGTCPEGDGSAPRDDVCQDGCHGHRHGEPTAKGEEDQDRVDGRDGHGDACN